MFHRVGATAYKADLSNSLRIMEVLDHPEKKFKSIHIAGTNGKGSSSHMLASILQAQGYKTGLYTSPHLKDFRERIRINGKMIAKSKVTDFVKKYRKEFDEIQPSFFEWTVGLAFDHFVTEQVDWAIIETGLGGRLDATNVIKPEVSLITNIGLDHTQFLGTTKAQIAWEKAGIIKPKVPVVISEFQPETEEVFRVVAKERASSLSFAGLHYQTAQVQRTANYLQLDVLEDKKQVYTKLQCDLVGQYQLQNILGVLRVIDVLAEYGVLVGEKAIRTGLKSVKTRTGLQGRWQQLSAKPLTIVDTAHNADGIQQILAQLTLLKVSKIHWVLGFVADKDIAKILTVLPQSAQYYFCKPDLPRGLDAAELQKQAQAHQLKGKVYGSVLEAFQTAQKSARSNDLVLVAGSNFIVAEVL